MKMVLDENSDTFALEVLLLHFSFISMVSTISD